MGLHYFRHLILPARWFVCAAHTVCIFCIHPEGSSMPAGILFSFFVCRKRKINQTKKSHKENRNKRVKRNKIHAVGNGNVHYNSPSEWDACGSKRILRNDWYEIRHSPKSINQKMKNERGNKVDAVLFPRAVCVCECGVCPFFVCYLLLFLTASACHMYLISVN